MPPVAVTRTYLELRDPTDLVAPRTSPRAATLDYVRHQPCAVPLYRRLYADVGGPWHWHDRLAWTDARLAEHLASPAIVVWELRADGESAGFFELQRYADGSVEIAYFGLRPAFVGRGLGGEMLTRAAREAWAMGATRVWLHTCTLDSPNALPNYRARGFREYRTESYEAVIDGA